MARLPERDLDDVLDAVHAARGPDAWAPLRGARIFVTGGTGFFGGWLLASLAHANRRLGLDARAVVLTRDPGAFTRRLPDVAAEPCLSFVQGDVVDFALPDGPFTHVLHAATAASAQLNVDAPRVMLDTIVAGTRRTLELARRAGAGRVLLVSSGGVYGPQPPDVARFDEDFRGAPDPLDPGAAYGEGKRVSELLGAVHARETGAAVVIARAFAFVGPLLPLDAHFAVGNFLRDALAGGPIRVGGDGTPLRSYLYASDLAAWLWVLLLHGPSLRPIHVGSGEALSIAELAALVAEEVAPPGGRIDVQIARAPVPGAPIARYVPSVDRAAAELGLVPRVDLRDAVRRTAAWHRGGEG